MLIGSVVVLACIAFFGYQEIKPQSAVEEFQEIVNDAQSEYFIARKDIEKYYDILGPERMAAMLNAMPGCHSSAHNLGKVIAIRTQDIGKAYELCDGVCTGGCIDGIFLGLFEDFVDEDLVPETSAARGADLHIRLTGENEQAIIERLLSICEENAASGQITIKGNCYHNLGHVVLYLVEYDLARAEKFCEIFGTPGDYFYCLSGLFMEHKAVYADDYESKDTFYPCDSNNAVPATCFRYGVERWAWDNEEYQPQNAAFIAEECLKIEDSYMRQGCFHGYGFNFFRNVRDGHTDLRTFCRHGDDGDQRMCIEATMGQFYGSTHLCNEVETQFQEHCRRAAQTNSYGYDKDFVEQYQITIWEKEENPS